MARDAVLQVAGLQTHFFTFGGTRVVRAVDGIDFTLRAGETLGLVGESGSGKTTTCLSIVGLLPRAARIVGGRVVFEGEDLTRKSQRELRRIRGRRIAVILQDPMASLNPLFTIYRQVAEPAFFHQHLRGRPLRERVQGLLRAVRIPSPEWRMREYPHQMSGGMRQRIVGAIALSGGPRLVIADEPTTNLDVTIQAQYLDLLKDIQRETGVALIFVTHNLGIVAKMCDRVAVMYAGKIVEQAPVRALRLAQASVHARAARLDAAARQQGAALLDPRPAPEPGQPAGGVRLSPALSRRHAALHDRGAARRSPGRRQRRAVLAPGRCPHPFLKSGR